MAAPQICGVSRMTTLRTAAMNTTAAALGLWLAREEGE